MAKPKSPLLSLGARGTIADALTYQKRGRDTIARVKPVPADPYSLPQAYQRWDYRDYAYLWTLLSNSEKQVYRTKASRYHITGFSLWMREKLKTLPDIALRLHLDEKGGPIAYDSSKQGNNGIIFGPSPAPGIIDNSYLFDGLNDGIVLPQVPILSMEDKDFTFEAFIHPTAYGAVWRSFIGGGAGSASLGLSGIPGQLRLTKVGIVDAPTSGQVIPLDTKSHIAARFNSHSAINNLDYFFNGNLVATVTFNVDFTTGAASNLIGLRTGIFHYHEGYIDEVIYHDSLVDATLIKRHSLRRYPA